VPKQLVDLAHVNRYLLRLYFKKGEVFRVSIFSVGGRRKEILNFFLLRNFQMIPYRI